MRTEQFPLTRRHLLRGAAAASLAASLAPPALAKAPMLNTQAPSFYRFRIGAFEATIVSDGPLALGDPAQSFVGAPKDEISRMLTDSFLAPDKIVVEQNALVVNTGDKLVLFDTGLGTSKLFGPTAGRLKASLVSAGINPADIDAIVLSHAHPDHCWGIMGEGGARNFPNAQIHMAQADFDFWTDEAKLGIDGLKAFIAGTRDHLLPNRERIVAVKDGQEVLPGIQAMAAPGHTVGHTVYVIASQGKSFLYIADTTHHPVLSYQQPRIEFVYDTDAKQGVATRLRILDMLATDRLPFLAYHLPWPGIGHVAKAGDGFRFVPEPMQMAL
jgi:glyoxylase-like metal-dependent hydrolase (beta-lactamase superfamily II)